jgi:AcrR family transcriptional regulator
MSTSIRKAYHHGHLRLALLEAGREVLAREGPAGLALRAVATRAGVSAAAPYRHFHSAEHFTAVLAADGFRRLGDALQEIADRPSLTEVDRLRAMARPYLTLPAEEPALYRLMFEGLIADRQKYPELIAAERRAEVLLAGAVEAAFTAGVITAASPADALLTMHCAVYGLGRLVVDGRITKTQAEPSLQRMMAVVEQGLLPRE